MTLCQCSRTRRKQYHLVTPVQKCSSERLSRRGPCIPCVPRVTFVELRDLFTPIERPGVLSIDLVIETWEGDTRRRSQRKPHSIQSLQVVDCKIALELYLLRGEVIASGGYFFDLNASLHSRRLSAFSCEDFAGLLLGCCNLPIVWPCSEQFIWSIEIIIPLWRTQYVLT